MGNFRFSKTDIDGIYIIEPAVYRDNRGTFMEIYNYMDFEIQGITEKFIQDNISISKKGTLRGLHFQRNRPQGKMVKVIQGEVFDVAVDIRAGSETFGKWNGFILNEYDNRCLFIPGGFAHGFLVLSDTAKVLYKCTDFFDPMDESGIIWNDPDIGVNWPIENIHELILSEKDKKWPKIKDIF